MTSSGRGLQNVKSKISQQHLVGYFPNFNLTLRGPKLKCTKAWNEDELQLKMTSNGRRPPKEDDLQWKTTSNGKQPQNMKIEIYQQPLVWFSNKSKMDQTDVQRQIKTTSYGRRNISSEISQQPLVGSFPNFKLDFSGPIWSVKRLKRKTTFNRRWPQNMKIEISQQPLVFFSNLS